MATYPEQSWVFGHGFTTPALEERDRRLAALSAPEAQQPQPVPVSERTQNPLRPRFLNEMVGQEPMRRLLARMLDSARTRHEPLDHVLLVGPAGIGKTTIAACIANELGEVALYQVEAPISHDALLSLRDVMHDGDLLFIDEIHQQAIMERRGRTTNSQPEVLLSVLEDFTLPSGEGVLSFPRITVVGATTDEGMLPDPFLDRFPIRPHFTPYSEGELARIASLNARSLNVAIDTDACVAFAAAARGVPRLVNNYLRNAVKLGGGFIDAALATEVIRDLNHTTPDGLTLDMQNLLAFLYTRGRHTRASGEVIYSASIGTIATAIGKSRDSKAVQLRIEPYLIARGYLQVGPGGRRLTDEGVHRARAILNERGFQHG